MRNPHVRSLFVKIYILQSVFDSILVPNYSEVFTVEMSVERTV